MKRFDFGDPEAWKLSLLFAGVLFILIRVALVGMEDQCGEHSPPTAQAIEVIACESHQCACMR